MTAAIVATTLVTDAKSKIVSAVNRQHVVRRHAEAEGFAVDDVVSLADEHHSPRDVTARTLLV